MQGAWSDNGCSISAFANDVQIVVNAIKSSSISDGDQVTTIPKSLSPDNEIVFPCVFFDSSNYPMIGWVSVTPNGIVNVKNYLANGHSAIKIMATCFYRSSI